MKPKLGRELMILTHDDNDDDDDDDDDVCMYVCTYVCSPTGIAGDHEHTWLGGEPRVNCSA